MKFIIFCFFFLTENLVAQQLKIKELHVSEICQSTRKNTYSSHEEDGPIVSLNILLINNTNKVIKLHPSASKFYLMFIMGDRAFKEEIFLGEYLKADTLSLAPNQNIELKTASELFLGTSILDQKKRNYIKELLESLPTLRVLYKESSYNISIFSDEIMKVTTDYSQSCK